MKAESYLKAKDLLNSIDRGTITIEMFSAKEASRVTIKFGHRNDDSITFSLDALEPERKKLIDKFLEISKAKIISSRDGLQKEFNEL